jgi:hypothetical protein
VAVGVGVGLVLSFAVGGPPAGRNLPAGVAPPAGAGFGLGFGFGAGDGFGSAAIIKPYLRGGLGVFGSASCKEMRQFPLEITGFHHTLLWY